MVTGDYYDGGSATRRLASVVYVDDGPARLHSIELLDLGLVISWSSSGFRNEDDCVVSERDASTFMHSFDVLGAESQYEGQSSARGISTNAFSFKMNLEEPMNATIEVSRDGWDLRTETAPVRASFETSSSSINWEFFDYTEPDNVNIWFFLPAAISYEASSSERVCDASGLVLTTEQAAALDALPFVDFSNGFPRRICDFGDVEGPIKKMPQLPQVFEVQAEANLIEDEREGRLKNYTLYSRNYYDGPNVRSAVIEVGANGSTSIAWN